MKIGNLSLIPSSRRNPQSNRRMSQRVAMLWPIALNLKNAYRRDDLQLLSMNDRHKIRRHSNLQKNNRLIRIPRLAVILRVAQKAV